MTLLLAFLWPGLAGALALGLVVGWLSGLPRGVLAPAVLALAMLALWGAALSGLAPGRAGLWIESAAAMLPVYVAGCLAGVLLRRLLGRKPTVA